jgi:hypothetical protein
VHIKLFVKRDCPRCPAAKHAVETFDDVEVFDVDDIEGLAEASFYSILATPTTLVVDSSGNEIESWRGEVPDVARLRSLIAQ